MGQPLSEREKQQWKENILKQRQSGLTVKQWCEKHNLKPHSFYYWVPKIFPKISNQSAFSEILDQNHPIDSHGSGISIEYKNVVLRLDPQFNQSTLKECLQVLREVLC